MHRIAGPTHALLRIAAGLLFICPGGMKLFGWFGGMPAGFTLTPLLTLAGVIEVVGGFLIMIGLFTRWVSFVASGEMACAYFIGHFPRGFWPILNQGQPAVLLCFIFLFLWGNGAGPCSVDAMIARRRTGSPGGALTRKDPSLFPLPPGEGKALRPLEESRDLAIS